jgi:pimeloyl-ACP methyl ester carboxylesterase
MGVDGRLFKNLRIDNAHIHFIRWETPDLDDTLHSYAMKLSKQIDTSRPFVLIGVSFGGMCSVEISKELKPLKTFVISSCKLSSELSWKIKFWKWFRVYRMLGNKRFIWGAKLVEKQFGVTNAEASRKFREMLEAAPKDYFKGAVHCIMCWRNEEVPASVVHIHGTNDRVLPIRKIKDPDHIIENGSHFMIVDRATEINSIIKTELEGLV